MVDKRLEMKKVVLPSTEEEEEEIISSKRLPAAKSSSERSWKSVLLSTPAPTTKFNNRPSLSSKELPAKNMKSTTAPTKFNHRPSSSSEMISSKGLPAANMKSAPTKFNNRQQQQVSTTTTIDDYKLLVFDDDDSQSPFPFRTFSLNQTIPPFSEPEPDPNLNPNKRIPYYEVAIMASLDGLVCVALASEKEVKLHFLNPLTGASKELPPFPHPHHSPPLSASDPVTFYVDSSGDYKLLWLVSDGLYGAFVYSRRSDSWEQIEFSAIPRKERLHCTWSPPIFCGNSLYFEVTCLVDLDDPSPPALPFIAFSRIIRFDVKTETFREIPVPHRLPIAKENAQIASIANLVLLDGCLHMYLLSNKFSDHQNAKCLVDLWRLIKEEEEEEEDDDDDDGCCDKWEKVDTFRGRRQQATHPICTVSIGNWLAVLDAHDNSFQKMNTQDFKTRLRRFTLPDVTYRASHMMYAPTLMDP